MVDSREVEPRLQKPSIHSHLLQDHARGKRSADQDEAERVTETVEDIVAEPEATPDEDEEPVNATFIASRGKREATTVPINDFTLGWITTSTASTLTDTTSATTTETDDILHWITTSTASTVTATTSTTTTSTTTTAWCRPDGADIVPSDILPYSLPVAIFNFMVGYNRSLTPEEFATIKEDADGILSRATLVRPNESYNRTIREYTRKLIELVQQDNPWLTRDVEKTKMLLALWLSNDDLPMAAGLAIYDELVQDNLGYKGVRLFYDRITNHIVNLSTWPQFQNGGLFKFLPKKDQETVARMARLAQAPLCSDTRARKDDVEATTLATETTSVFVVTPGTMPTQERNRKVTEFEEGVIYVIASAMPPVTIREESSTFAEADAELEKEFMSREERSAFAEAVAEAEFLSREERSAVAETEFMSCEERSAVAEAEFLSREERSAVAVGEVEAEAETLSREERSAVAEAEAVAESHSRHTRSLPEDTEEVTAEAPTSSSVEVFSERVVYLNGVKVENFNQQVSDLYQNATEDFYTRLGK